MDLIIREFNPKVGENLIRYALEHFWNNDVAVACQTLSFPKSSEYKSLKHLGFFTCPQFVRPNPFALYVKPLDIEGPQHDRKYLMDSNNWFFMFGDYQVYKQVYN